MSLNPIEVRVKLHDRIDSSYAKLQVCLCLNVASEESDPCLASRKVVEIVVLRERFVSPADGDWKAGKGGEGNMTKYGRLYVESN